MKAKDIHNLEDLRKAKTELKARMKQSDQSLQSGWVYSTLDNLFSGKKKESKPISPALDSGTLNALHFLGKQQGGGLAGTLARILPAVAAVAVPFLIRFATKWVQKRFRA